MRTAWLTLLVLGVLAVAPDAHAAAPTRYSLAGGCYALDGLDGAERVRMQATALGSYLLYRPDATYVGADGVADEPGPATDWSAREAGGGRMTLTPASDPARAVTVTPRATDGCAAFPEAELNATGRPKPAALPFGEVGGLVEGHMHWMTFEYFGGNFHCGRPWHRYGITRALPDCAEIEGPQGTAAPFQNFFNFGNPAQPHDTRGYPQMTEFRSSNLTYEGTYWRWIQRAWLGGLRVMVMGVNENRVLCELQTNRRHDCDEMNTVRRGITAIRELEDYVDAQAGGPGKGFFEIVTDPFQARRVINQGRMAVILEIEISEPFGCRNLAEPTCDRARVDRELQEMYDLGVRSSLLLNKFDNPLTGVRFDDGPVGAVINAGNRASAGSFWSARTCENPDLSDNTIETGSSEGSAFLNQIIETLGVQPGTTPTYPPAPHCNTRGLTALGKHLVRRMMRLNMIVNPDHMSQAAVDDTLTILEDRNYSGVISPHGWMDPGNWPRLWKLGGLAFPGHSSAQSYVDEWKDFRPRQTPYRFGWGYGADLGGLSQQPRVTDDSGDIGYPFKSYDGRVTFDQQTTGERTFDYRTEGVAHYGLYPEWFEDLRRLGGRAMARDMWAGGEAYVEMWERAAGVPAARRCKSRGGAFTARGRGPLRVGLEWPALLRRAGQPQERTRTWSYCVRGPRNEGLADVAVLSRSGRVQLVGSTAYGRGVGNLRTGKHAGFSGLRVRGRQFAVARGGRVRAVGVATKGLVRRRAALRAAVTRVLRARATQKRLRYKPGKAERASGGGPTGRVLAGTQNPRLNRALTLLCQLQA